jgi:aminomethyltransferase
LAARDTLRLEAAMPLYGHELDESINAAQTSLKFAINLKNRSFAGRDAIVTGMSNSSLPIRVGLKLQGRRPAREGCPILACEPSQHDAPIGHLTSGTLSPTLGIPIAMGYLNPSYAQPGTQVSIDIRGKFVAAEVVALPFYERSSH